MADNQNAVLSDEELARMSDAELVEALRLTGGRLIHNAGIWARGGLEKAASELQAELARRLPDAGDDVAEEIVTEAAQLPPAASSVVAVATSPAVAVVPSGTLINMGAGAAGGWALGKVMGKKGALLPILGAIAGYMFRPIQ